MIDIEAELRPLIEGAVVPPTGLDEITRKAAKRRRERTARRVATSSLLVVLLAAVGVSSLLRDRHASLSLRTSTPASTTSSFAIGAESGPEKFTWTTLPPGFELVNEFVHEYRLNLDGTQRALVRTYKFRRGNMESLSLLVWGPYRPGPPPAERPGQPSNDGQRTEVRGKRAVLIDTPPTMMLGWTEDASADLVITTRSSTVNREELLHFAEGLQKVE